MGRTRLTHRTRLEARRPNAASGASRFLFCFYPSLVTFWGTLVANDAKIVHFTFYVYSPNFVHRLNMPCNGYVMAKGTCSEFSVLPRKGAWSGVLIFPGWIFKF